MCLYVCSVCVCVCPLLSPLLSPLLDFGVSGRYSVFRVQRCGVCRPSVMCCRHRPARKRERKIFVDSKGELYPHAHSQGRDDERRFRGRGRSRAWQELCSTGRPLYRFRVTLLAWLCQPLFCCRLRLCLSPHSTRCYWWPPRSSLCTLVACTGTCKCKMCPHSGGNKDRAPKLLPLVGIGVTRQTGVNA